MKKTVFQLVIIFLVMYGVLYVFIQLGPQEAETKGKGKERDIEIPRAPGESKGVKNPLSNTLEIIAKGREIYHGKGTCFVCHGNTGKGDGPSGAELNPRPRNFTNPRFQEIRTDGELFWVIRNGSPGTRMFSYFPAIIDEEDSWAVIHYLRTLPLEAQKEAAQKPAGSDNP